ncbi:MAG: hypothetical protein U0168_31720 [Nannocystaceae bacterium]
MTVDATDTMGPPPAAAEAPAPAKAVATAPEGSGDEAPRKPLPEIAAPAPGRGSRMRSMLLAPVLATLAVGVHWAINVPHGSVKVSEKDQGAAKADNKKKPPKRPAKKNFEARPQGELDAAFTRYETVDFDAEPMKSAWARPHQTLVNKAVTYARSIAFEGAPEEPRVSVEAVECRTIRCRFVLRGPFAHEVELLAETLSQVTAGGSNIWRSYVRARVDAPKPDQPKSDTYVQVTVVFREDNLDSADFELPQEGGGAVEDTEPRRRPPEGAADDDDEPNEAGEPPQ